MGFVPFANVVRAEMVFSWAGQSVENVLHYVQAGGWTAPEMTQLADALIEYWDTNWKVRVATTCALTKIRLTDMASQTGMSFDYAEGLPLVGTGTGASMPNNVTVAIKLNTLNRGRSYRGRIYHVGMLIGQASGSVLAAGEAENFQTRYSAITTLALVEDVASMVVCSRVSGGVERTTGVATVVSGVSVNGTLDSQRRRLPERGQ
jgi:hypothetical protein